MQLPVKSSLLFSTAVLVGLTMFTGCSQKTKEDSKEAAQSIGNDIKSAANKSSNAVKDAASDVKEGADNIASDVKDATKATAEGIKEAKDNAVSAINAKVAKLDKSTRLQYDALNKEIDRVDAEIKSASQAKKASLEITKAKLIKQRDALIK
jgi:phage-related protein